MAIPKDILAVKRPSSTRVKEQNGKYMVIKRTSKQLDDGRIVPVELGVIGHIVDYKYVPKEPKVSTATINVKEYGRVALANKLGEDIKHELYQFFNIHQADQIYAIALLRAAFPSITGRDVKFRYDNTFLSEILPNVGLSENTISKLLITLGSEYITMKKYMNFRIESVVNTDLLVVDSTLKSYNADNPFSKYTKKGKVKSSKNVSLMYAFNVNTGEPVAAKAYPGNMVDCTICKDFIIDLNLKNCIITADKAFSTKELTNLMIEKGIKPLVPIKRNSKIIKDENLLDFTGAFIHDEEKIFFNKKKVGQVIYYAFKTLKDEAAQKETFFDLSNKGKEFDLEKYSELENKAGTIVFSSTIDTNPETIFKIYEMRWERETFFNMSKNIVQIPNVRVHQYSSVIATEFINFLTALISIRIKHYLTEKGVLSKFSYNQTFNYLSSVYKTNDGINKDNWTFSSAPKYVMELVKKLEI